MGAVRDGSTAAGGPLGAVSTAASRSVSRRGASIDRISFRVASTFFSTLYF